MSPDFHVRCTQCGSQNQMRMERVYQRVLCNGCGAEIDMDATATLEMILDDKPVKLVRDDVTVGFRERTIADRKTCSRCGSSGDLQMEDVLDLTKVYHCKNCGRRFKLVNNKGE